MSVPVPLADLPDQVSRFDLGPYLVTVAADRTPRTTSIAVTWRGDLLAAGLGRRTSANIHGDTSVTLLWPAPAPGQHALIVDGSADLDDAQAPEDGATVLIRPTKAVLHVTRPGPTGT
jgi:hypothetical protein